MSRTIRPHQKSVTRFHTPDGKRCTRDTPGAVKSTHKTETWYAKLDGVWTSLRTTDEGKAWDELRRLLKRRSDRASGLTDDYTDHAATSLAVHVDAWIADVRAGGAGTKHVSESRSNVLALAEAAGWKRLPDVTSSTCLDALARLVSERDLGPRTRNAYLTHVKAFTRWASMAARGNRLRADPLAGLGMLSVEEDVRHARRRPTPDELTRLWTWLDSPEAAAVNGFRHTFKNGSVRRYSCRLTPRQRKQGYRVCLGTGLRAGELRSLTRQSFDLDRGTVTLRARADKRGKTATLSLPDWLRDELADYFAAGNECWGRLPGITPGRVLQFDWGRAGVAYETAGPDGPTFLDFHALRHSYISALCDDPLNTIKTVQTMARHSDPSLTLRVYSHSRREDVEAAAKRLLPP